MNAMRRKELLQAYQHRKPEKGVISLCCTETGQVFLGLANDTRGECNSLQAKLNGGRHPNKQLQQLWNQYGARGFVFTVAKVLHYEDPNGNYAEALENLRLQCFAENPHAQKIWR